MITLDEQIEWAESFRSTAVSVWDGGSKTVQIYDAILATLRSVKQAEPVACNHEPYQGRCVHCDVEYKDGRPFYAAPAAPQSPGRER